MRDVFFARLSLQIPELATLGPSIADNLFGNLGVLRSRRRRGGEIGLPAGGQPFKFNGSPDSMTRNVLFFILASVLLSAGAQLLLRAGMSSPSVTEGLAHADWRRSVIAVAFSPLVVSGLFVYFLSAAVWSLVLSRVQVSLAYPFVGLGFIVTMLLGYWLQGDTLNAQKVAGTLVISVGVFILARA